MYLHAKARWEKAMIYLKIGITLIFLIFIISMILKEYKKLDSEDRSKFKRELVYETGILYVGYLLLFVSAIFLNPLIRNISVILILIGWFYQGVLSWKENRKRSIFIFVLVMLAAYIIFNLRLSL